MAGRCFLQLSRGLYFFLPKECQTCSIIIENNLKANTLGAPFVCFPPAPRSSGLLGAEIQDRFLQQ